MLKNYLIIAFRQLLKHKTLGVLYIMCLGVGVSAAIMLYKYCDYESNYDKYLDHSGQLFRVNMVNPNSDEQNSARTSPAVAKALVDNFPMVKDFSRVVLFGDASVITNQKSVKESDILLVEKRHFDLFSYQFKPGSRLEGFDVPGTMVISERLAQKLFGEADPVGLNVKINSPNLGGSQEFEIKGVYENIRKDSHLKPELLVSFATVKQHLGADIESNWHWNNLFTYILVNEKAFIDDLEIQFNHYVEDLPTQAEGQYEFQNITDIHNDPSVFSEFDVPVNAETLNYLLMLAFLILVITYINVINLYASIAGKRMKEVGVRKSSGAGREQLFWQFMIESFFINLAGIVVAITIIQTILPAFESYFNIHGSLNIQSISDYIPELCVLLLAGTCFTGFYPALVMSAWQPQLVLKGGGQVKIGGIRLRSVFLLIQFVVSIFLIAGTLTVSRQIDYILYYDIGLDASNKLVIRQPNIDDAKQSLPLVKSLFRQLPDVTGITAADAVPGMEIYWRSNDYSRDQGKSSDHSFNYLNVESHFFEVFDMPILNGVGFQAETGNNGTIIINQTAVEALGFQNSEEAIGKVIYANDNGLTIRGVVKDFYQQGLKSDIKPTIYNYAAGNMNYYIVQFKSSETRQLVAQLQEQWNKSFSDSPFDYFFLDEFFNKQYGSDLRFQKFFSVLCLISILVSIIGLLGIILQHLQLKEKQIGIRKILGAGLRHIMFHLSKGYLKIFVVAYVAAIILAYVIMELWLSDFADKVELGLSFFVLPLIIFFFIVGSVLMKQIIAAINKPVIDSLRSE
ncbi:ABC transporter permease [Fulvivirga maritima]|uniref:ABC transporter permease n=1 Tax=Fulvivirga maritima TaxID=2904247 RepID=UPI001F2FB277|nr:ABC transporter permease [Fulvivirga maritima]UII26087.1 ABC transporter permease [Fulvivirga maritima]